MKPIFTTPGSTGWGMRTTQGGGHGICVRTATALLYVVFMIPLCGCQQIGALMYLGMAERTRTVQPEYGGLEGTRLLVYVWADQATLFEYAAIRQDIASHIKYYLGQQVDMQFVPPVKVERFQRETYDVDSYTPVQVGRRYHADMVLHIQVLSYSVRPPDLPNVFRGHLDAQCVLYDSHEPGDSEYAGQSLWNGRVEIYYPQDSSISTFRTNEATVRLGTVQVFSDAIAKKFYEHKVSLDQ